MNEAHATLIEEKRIEYIIRIVSTMAEVHDMDILHRDLCPSNILLKNGSLYSLYISDFGLGKSLSEEYSRYTTNTTAFGHYGYIAPEQFNNLKDASKQSDVFSLGKIINFIMTNEYDNTDHIFSTVCVAATAQNELIRYSDAKELLEAIQSTHSKIKDTRFAEACLSLISNNQYNPDVWIYLSSMDAITTHNNFKIPHYRDVLIYFLKIEPSHNFNFLTKLRKAMHNC